MKFTFSALRATSGDTKSNFSTIFKAIHSHVLAAYKQTNNPTQPQHTRDNSTRGIQMVMAVIDQRVVPQIIRKNPSNDTHNTKNKSYTQEKGGAKTSRQCGEQQGKAF